MAICHFSYKMFTRSKGHSAVSKAAYRAAEKLLDIRLEKTFDYTNKNDLLYKEIILAKNAAERFLDRETLWNEVEAVEKRKDSQLAREIEVSLPKELTEEENIKLAREFVKDKFVSIGMIADLCIHRGHGRDQPHAHIMLTTREVSEEGFGQKVVEWDKQPVLYKWREEWANYTNKHLAKAGLDLKIDHRSYKEQGIELEPQNKIGPNNGRQRFSEKVLEHHEIARGNGEKIYNDPNIAIKALTHYKSTFTHEDLAKFINTHTVDKEQFDLVYEKVKTSPEMVKLGMDDRNKEKFTSQEMLELEYRMVRQSQALSLEDKHQVDFGEREELIKEHNLTESQAEAFRHVTGDRDMACVVGYAGSGKSYMLGAARKVWESQGYNVVGMTLSGIAAENLEGDAGIKSYTVANRIVNWDNDRERLTKNDVIVVDEAGMLGSRDMGRVIDEATLAGSKVVLIGDAEQLKAIEAGAAFRGVIERVGHVDLTEIRRQKELWQQEATKCLALGEIGDALQSYNKKDMVHKFDDVEAAKEVMVNDWHETFQEHKSSIMLGFTRADVKALNERAREIRKSYNELGIYTDYQTERGKREFAIKDKVYFLKNDKELGVKNGTLGTITSLYNYTFEVELDKGGEIKFDIRDYKSIDHGYAATIHKSQGITVDRTFLLASEYMNRHATYVGMSRHMETVDMYWSKDRFSDFKAMERTLSREDRKELTLDYVKEDFKESTEAMANCKNIEVRSAIESLRENLDLIRADHSKSVDEFAKMLHQELKPPFFETSIDNFEKRTYLGNVTIDGQKHVLLEEEGMEYDLLANMRVTKDIEYGDEVRVMLNGDNKQESVLIKDDDIDDNFVDKKELEYEKSKSTYDLNKLSRGLESRENMRVEKNISTKDIYKELYNRLPSVLPEFRFERKGNCYISTTGYKVDGSQGQKGKVYVYENNPGVLVDYTRGNKSIWDYVSESEGISDKKDIFEYLANAAGIKSYFNERFEILQKNKERNAKAIESIISPEAKENKVTSNISSELWEKVYEYSLDKMEVKNNQIDRYLKETRGYNSDIIKDMGIGYLPNKKELVQHLKNNGISQEKTEELVKALGCIGYSHKMIMPFYGKEGEIMGLTGRDIKYNEDSRFGKYIYSKGLARSSTMLGIHEIDKNKPLTIVEGMLDALHAKAVGIDNVVALGGTGINIRQLELIDSFNIKAINLCLDNDRAGREATENIALQLNDRNKDIEINQVEMPENIKDLDQLITEKGTKETKDILEGAKEVNMYKLTEEREMQMMDKFQKDKNIGGYEYELEYKG